MGAGNVWVCCSKAYLIFVTNITNEMCGEIFFMWRNFQISMRHKCGEIWNFSTCGVISNFAKWKMWRNLKFLHIWHVCDEENGSTCVKFLLFCCKIGFVAIYTLMSQIFLSQFTLFCVEKKLTNNCVVGEKWQISGMGAIYFIYIQHYNATK